mmetsp:Transcript_99683/g.282309  ORF Transcript_99683/g.282309 Transcript_99683/m.282309 type:complete len:816 (-) Transcript_99683:229-2676(-)
MAQTVSLYHAERPRSVSPTRMCWEIRQEAQQKLSKMQSMGLHVFDPEWNRNGFRESGHACTRAETLHSASFRDITVKIHSTGEQMTVPVQVCTRVWDVKCAIAGFSMTSPEQLTFVVKQGCTFRIQNDNEEVGRVVTIKGITAFAPQAHKWPNPTIIIGAGYNGIKNALLYAHYGNRDFVMYDRYDRVGGHAWIVQANKTSKLQTELSAFHVWFGMEWSDTNPKLGCPTEFGTWPKKDECLAHMQHACDRYDLIPHINFRTNIVDIQIMGKLTDWDRYYVCGVQQQGREDAETKHVPTNILYHFPGAYFNPRIINYPGEDTSDIQVGYGMNDDIPFDYLDGNRAAILGNGAFAVENIRTCMEYGVTKVFLVTRKKNLPSPRMCCWFVHQSITPVPAKMLLRIFEPMFDISGFGDPWQYHSVFATKDRKNCTISSHSRFGIGDVTFLAMAWGRCEYVVDLCKRCTYRCIHTVGGKKLEDVRVIIKCLGLIADFACDRMHKLKEMVGTWPHGDHRRIIFADPLGMHAANFSSFSAGIGAYVSSHRDKHLADFPQEFLGLIGAGVLEMLPKMKAEDDKPAHQMSSQYLTSVSMIVDGALPRSAMKMAGLDQYFHKMVWITNPFDKYYDECKNSWDQYQNDWWQMGFDHEYTPYPYSKDMVTKWFEDYRETVGPTDLDGKEYAPRLRGKIVKDYVPSWERDGDEPAQQEEESPEEAPEAAPEPQPAPAVEDQAPEEPAKEETSEEKDERERQEAEQKAAQEAAIKAYFDNQAAERAKMGEINVVDPMFGSVFQETPWDKDGARMWWMMNDRAAASASIY